MSEAPHPSASDVVARIRRDLRLPPAGAPAATVPPDPDPAPAVGSPDPTRRCTELEIMRSAREVTSILDLDPLLQRVLDEFVTITDAERGCLLLVRDDGGLDFGVGAQLNEAEFVDQPHIISRSAAREVASSGQSLFVDDVLTQGVTIRESVNLMNLRSYCCVPLVADGRVRGACYTDSHRPRTPLGREDRALLESFASHAAAAICNAQRHEALVASKAQLEAENAGLRQQVERRYRFANIRGESDVMRHIFAVLEKVAVTDTTVLLTGETGTGKELLARALHTNGPRHNRRFVAVNSAGLVRELAESSLFGHKKGAFTGAIADHSGFFEEADGGTLFLDEIGEMPLALQAKILRVLQEGALMRVGENHERKVDVRIVCATNRDLLAEVQAGNFREDLYYRLNVVGIRVPALRERGNDVLMMAEEFVREFAATYAKKDVRLATEARRWIGEQVWRGNVRELRHCIQRAVTLCDDDAVIGVADLESPFAPPPLVPAAVVVPLRGAAAAVGPPLPLGQRLDQVEGDEVRRALGESGWRMVEAARQLGISRQYLHKLLKKHGIAGARERNRYKT